MFRRTIIILVGLLLAACNLAVPAATPTIAPTRTASPMPPATDTPFPTLIAQVVPSDTFTPQPTNTPTLTATATLTLTPRATFTHLPSNTPLATNTNQPTATPTFTPSATTTHQPSATATHTALPTATNTEAPTVTVTPSVTPLPFIPSDTATSTATDTSTPTATSTNTATVTPTATDTLPPSPTATRTLSPEELATFSTPLGFSTPPAQPTAAPTLAPAITQPAPTLDVTPTFVTAQATISDEGILTLTPLPFDTTPQAGFPTTTPQPTVALVVTIPPTLGAAPTGLPFTTGNNPTTLAFALTTSGGISGTNFSLLNDTTLFERDPVDANEYVTTDSSGNLYITGVNGSGAARIDQSPFSQFIPQSKDANNAFVSAARWSPNGQYVAFIVAGRKLANDGVWVFQPGQAAPQQLLVDCPSKGFPGCSIVSNPFDPDLWDSQSIAWSPNNDALLVGVHLDAENRDGILVVPMGQNYNTRPNIYRYDYGSWATDGSRILVSGRAGDGHEYVGWINRDGSFSELVYDAEANHLWMGFAHQAQDGQIYALGAPGDRNGPQGPLQIFNMNGQPLTGAIGTGFPDRVEWSPDGTAVFVQTAGRQYIASINGNVSDITGQVSGSRAVNWVNGSLPPSAPTSAPAQGIAPVGEPATPVSGSSIPSGVIAGSEYQAGQQLRVYSTDLNIRTGPGVSYDFAGNPLVTGDYVVILAGPVDADGARWWQVQTASGVVGWIAGTVNGAVTLGP